MQKSLFLLLILMILVLQACGGGGGGTASTPTPAGTTVNLATFKGVFLGTAAGTQFSFPTLTGTDSQGRAWSGSFTVAADGATVFEGQNVIAQRSLVTLQLVGGASASGTTTSYFLSSNGSPYKFISTTGVTYLPTSSTPLPATATVGESGPLMTVTGSDGSTATVTWALDADFNGVTVMTLSTVTRTGTTITATELDSFYLDAAGVPTKVMINVTTAGTVVTLTGNRAP